MKNTIRHTLIGVAVAGVLMAGTAQSTTMLGAYIDHDGWNTAPIDQFNTDVAKPLAVVNLFSSFGQDWGGLAIQASNIVSRKATPLITWMPSISSRPDANLLGEISSGQWDGYIDGWINSLKLWQASYPADQKPTVLLRFAHEFNGNWYPWSNDPDGFKTAWRYLHSRFAQAGVTGVEWVWCANNVSVDNYNDITRYYPGNDVVNWTALDGYNWGSNYSFTQWKGFAEVFSAPYTTLVTNYPDKPVLLAEVASAEPQDLPNADYGMTGNDSDAGQSKAVWVQDMYTRMLAEYPAIRAVAWFNTNKELSWALNGAGNTGLAAYNTVIADSRYTGTFTALLAPEPTKTRVAKGGGGGKRYTTTLESIQQERDAGTQRALALSKLPAVVGTALLAREAHGFRRLPAAARAVLREDVR
ncbi:glycoside hydrolase family 26 protein [Thiothrix subterranea]|uniref:Glycosyl hydrolase n=1 Tax=Thiothrix subterranea TaxID=2735563 RepID=A0AA51MPZ1_9GAMM|nr:glycosyl hydrolase [Thiothrix subterranea]MDQ5769463.1 glycosyl hydrolase [Thiothrix subterranea]WML86327.1 glycosyl hydrolase [Thiothrix subterranea]